MSRAAGARGDATLAAAAPIAGAARPRTSIALMAYSTWNRRPSGEKVDTPRSYAELRMRRRGAGAARRCSAAKGGGHTPAGAGHRPTNAREMLAAAPRIGGGARAQRERRRVAAVSRKHELTAFGTWRMAAGSCRRARRGCTSAAARWRRRLSVLVNLGPMAADPCDATRAPACQVPAACPRDGVRCSHAADGGAAAAAHRPAVWILRAAGASRRRQHRFDDSRSDRQQQLRIRSALSRSPRLESAAYYTFHLSFRSLVSISRIGSHANSSAAMPGALTL